MTARRAESLDPSTAGRRTNYTTLSLAEVSAGLDDIARDARATFGPLNARQLNWRPDPAQWSIAQCFDHLLAANRLMFQAADDALRGARPRTVWQSMPVLPGLFGRLLIRSQAPDGARKFSAPAEARPASSDINGDVIERFVAQQRDAVARAQALDERHAARTIMTSPFVRVVTYSVLDGWRLIVTHERRHVEQARRVTACRDFPRRVVE